jgi:CO dehydrogenase/acetyl-CoA synthase beta subunit
MQFFNDLYNRNIRLTPKREHHIFTDHPEMEGQLEKIKETLKEPDIIIRSKSDFSVQLFYKNYSKTPVTNKYLCSVVKILENQSFIITAYFIDSIKKGEVLWKKK